MRGDGIDFEAVAATLNASYFLAASIQVLSQFR